MTLLKKTRLYIILLVMAMITILLTFATAAINIFLYNRIYGDSFVYLEKMAQNGGVNMPPEAMMKNKPFDGKGDRRRGDFDFRGGPSPDRLPEHFPPDKRPHLVFAKNLGFRAAMSFVVDCEHSEFTLISGRPDEFSEEETKELCTNILALKKQKGSYEGYFFNLSKTSEGKCLVCLLNRYSELQYLVRLNKYSVLIWVCTLLLGFLVSSFFSRLLIKPIENSFERQKQFISDSSHELRTPISVIDANLSVVMAEYPDNKWLGYIKDENQRMGQLVKDLLFLTRNDQNRQKIDKKEFDFSSAVTNAVLPFESIIFEEGKYLELKTQDGLKANGDENSIKQLITILLDNALKYSNDGGIIKVNAYQEGQYQTVKVYNTGNGIKKENLDKIFRRFFREDKARTGLKSGYGLGLSIAKSIASLHNGILTADSDGESWVEFTLKLR
jgi:hypothetical protein